MAVGSQNLPQRGVRDCLETAAGGLEYPIEDLLGLERHPSPRFIGSRTLEQSMEGIEHGDLLARSVARIVLSHGEPLGPSVHVKIANVGDKLWTVQIIPDIGAEAREDKIVDPNASLFAADVAPLLVLSRKRAIKAC